MDTGNISKCCRGIYRFSGGFEFRYAEPIEPGTIPGEMWRDAVDPRTGEVIRCTRGKQARVSSLGRVHTSKGTTTWGCRSLSGYYNVRIGGKPHAVHRLVARAFHGPLALQVFKECDVHHKDGDKSNNRVANLEYATRSDNIKYSFALGRRTSREALSKPVEGRAVGADRWQPYTSQIDAARKLGLHSGCVSNCCNGRIRQTGGYEFRLIPDFAQAEVENEEWRNVILPEKLMKFTRK